VTFFTQNVPRFPVSVSCWRRFALYSIALFCFERPSPGNVGIGLLDVYTALFLIACTALCLLSYRRRRRGVDCLRVCLFARLNESHCSMTSDLRSGTIIAFNSSTPSRIVFGRPFVKRFALCYPTAVCLSVTLVYCGQTVGWIRMPLRAEVGLGPDDIVLDGDPAPTTEIGRAASPTFRPIALARSPISVNAELLLYRKLK